MMPEGTDPNAASTSGAGALPADDLSYVHNSEHSGRQDGVPGRDMNLAESKTFAEWAGNVGKGLSMFGGTGLASGLIGRDMQVRDAENAVAGAMGAPNNPELMGRAEMQGGAGNPGDAGMAAGEMGGLGGNRDGGFARGGIVKRAGLLGPNPKGPDQGYAALKGGERVLTVKQYEALSDVARAEVDAVMKKTGAKGMKK